MFCSQGLYANEASVRHTGTQLLCVWRRQGYFAKHVGHRPHSLKQFKHRSNVIVRFSTMGTYFRLFLDPLVSEQCLRVSNSV